MSAPVGGFRDKIQAVGDFLLRPTAANQNKKLRLFGSIAIGILTLGTAHALFGAIGFFAPRSVTPNKPTALTKIRHERGCRRFRPSHISFSTTTR